MLTRGFVHVFKSWTQWDLYRIALLARLHSVAALQTRDTSSYTVTLRWVFHWTMWLTRLPRVQFLRPRPFFLLMCILFCIQSMLTINSWTDNITFYPMNTINCQNKQRGSFISVNSNIQTLNLLVVGEYTQLFPHQLRVCFSTGYPHTH